MGRRKRIVDIENTNIEENASSKRKSKKVFSKEELYNKKKAHQTKIIQKQEARLAKHIERVTNKEKNVSKENEDRFYVTNAKLMEQLFLWRDSGKKLKSNQHYELRSENDENGNVIWKNQIIDENGNTISEEENRVIPEEFGKMVLMIAKRLSNHSNFENYPYEVKQDMISYACFKCIQGLHNYNFNFKNAFAYFTTACYNAFISTISAYYKHINIRKDLLKKAIEKLESTKELKSSQALNNFLREYIGEDFSENGNCEED